MSLPCSRGLVQIENHGSQWNRLGSRLQMLPGLFIQFWRCREKRTDRIIENIVDVVWCCVIVCKEIWFGLKQCWYFCRWDDPGEHHSFRCRCRINYPRLRSNYPPADLTIEIPKKTITCRLIDLYHTQITFLVIQVVQLYSISIFTICTSITWFQAHRFCCLSKV
jgi:hypothetical protein